MYKRQVLSSRSVYIIDDDDKARQCIISDGEGNPIFKVIYGYHKQNGRLIAESMFDLRTKRVNEDNKEVPVQRLYYKYDPHGNRSKPFAITSVKGKAAEKTEGFSKHIQDNLNRIKFGNNGGSTVIEQEDIGNLNNR